MSTVETNDIEFGRSDAAPKLTLRGRLTVDAARRLHEASVELCRGGGDVTVAAAGVEYADAAILQVLAVLAVSLNRHDRRLAFADASEGFRTSVRLAGLGDLLLRERP